MLAVFALIALAAGGAYCLFTDECGGRGARPGADTGSPERSELAQTVPPPPFRIMGTLLSPTGRAAIIAVVEADVERPSQKVGEGETLEGYLLQRIEMHRVYFEKDGTRFMLVVGGSQPSPPSVLPDDAILPTEPREPKMMIVPPPAEVEQVHRDMKELFERMRQSPKFRDAKERKRREIEEQREKEELRAR